MYKWSTGVSSGGLELLADLSDRQRTVLRENLDDHVDQDVGIHLHRRHCIAYGLSEKASNAQQAHENQG
jgi:hypothetical protein